jgi:dienelactone hydrolase
VAEVALFHHAQGQTEGFLEFCQALRGAGHEVQAPDLLDGRVFTDLDEAVVFAESLGMDEIFRRAEAAVDGRDVVFAGFSLGAMAAQSLVQGRGARGALLFHGGADPKWFPQPWPEGVPLQVHTSEQDPWVELDEVRALAAVADGEVFLYPGSAHLFADPSSPEYDAAAADLLLQRSLAFLAGL